MKTAQAVIALIAAVLSLNTASADIGYQFVLIGNPGNANDSSGYGRVNYTYAIGKYDVTVSQYTTFLNAVAQADPYGLYRTEMATDLNIAGIARSGSSGSYSYSVVGDGNRPVTYVSWFDAARFANWMNNGQLTGLGEVAATTEQGAYTLNGITSGGVAFSRNANATYWITSENEWYKAAYYDPNKGGLGAGGYWLYPTMSNSAPGNVVGNAANQANYYTGAGYSVTQSSTYSSTQNYLTPVGAYSNSASAYGTYDQGGNVYQWNDGVIGSSRGVRAAGWSDNDILPPIYYSGTYASDAGYESSTLGFRLAGVAANAIPTLTIILSSDTTLILAWSASVTGWTLQQTSLLAPVTIWSNVATTPTVLNGQNQAAVTVSSSDSRLFFRLTHP